MIALRRTGLGGLALVLLTLLVSVNGGASARASRAFRSPFEGFPLWKDVPGERFAPLREGNFRGTRWAAYASRRGRGRRYREQPCLTLARISRLGEYGLSLGCAPLAPGPHAEAPLYRLLGVAGGGDKAEPASYFAVLLAPQVVDVTIEGEAGYAITRHAELLSRHKQVKAAVPSLRYVAFVVPRNLCVEGIIGFGREGETLLETSPAECP
jgi:hypothetical protein